MYKVYDFILNDACDKDTIEFAMGMVWCEIETNEEYRLPDTRFIHNVNGIDIYYQYGADYYLFVEEDIAC